MKVFSWLYTRSLMWAGHKHAPRYLGLLSFAESSFFPIPPDVMLAPMVLRHRDRAWWYASLTTITSVLGGVLGYYIGVFLYAEVAQPILEIYHAEERFLRVQEWFAAYGFWVVFIAGFTPIPYKVFTISAGVTAMALLPFIIASSIGRGARFFLVAGILYWGGPRFADVLETKLDKIGWTMVVLAILAYIVLREVSWASQ